MALIPRDKCLLEWFVSPCVGSCRISSGCAPLTQQPKPQDQMAVGFVHVSVWIKPGFQAALFCISQSLMFWRNWGWRERERHSSWTRMEGTHVESSSPRNKHFRWLEMDFSTTSVPWMLQRVHARPAGTNWVLRLELSLSFQALLQGCNFKCFRAKGRLAQE